MLSAIGIALVVGCQTKTEEYAAKSKPAPKTKTVAPVEPKTETKTTEPEKTETKTVLLKPEPELPPAPPSTQELAVEELKKRGGKATFNRNNDVVEVDWAGAEITDNDLVILQKFPYLRKLDLTGTSITGAGLKHLKNLEYIRYLFLLGTNVSDAGVAELQGHSRLEQLCLDETKVGDAGVKYLAPLGRLVMLHLQTQGEITDASVETLVKLKDLKELKIEGTKITEDGKAKLVKALPEIEFIGGPDGAIPID